MSILLFTSLLFLIYSFKLTALLREVKYLLQRDVESQPIPESASAVYSQNDVYCKYIQNLDVIVSLYNR